jgi:hypothetical protein
MDGSRRSRVARRIAAAAFAALLAAAPASAAKRRAFATSVSGTGDLQPGRTRRGDGCPRGRDLPGAPRATPTRCQPRPTARGSRRGRPSVLSRTGARRQKATGCSGAVLPGAGPWFLSNGATNFSGTLDDLVDGGELYRPISRDEHFDALPTIDRSYWTATDSAGVWTGVDCSGWADDTPGQFVGTVGDGYGIAGFWSLADEMACAGDHRLLCVSPGELPARLESAAIAF